VIPYISSDCNTQPCRRSQTWSVTRMMNENRIQAKKCFQRLYSGNVPLGELQLTPLVFRCTYWEQRQT